MASSASVSLMASSATVSLVASSATVALMASSATVSLLASCLAAARLARRRSLDGPFLALSLEGELLSYFCNTVCFPDWFFYNESSNDFMFLAPPQGLKSSGRFLITSKVDHILKRFT